MQATVRLPETHLCMMVNFILGTMVEPPSHIINFINVFAKQLIYKCRCQKKKVTVAKFIVELELQQQIEISVSKLENTVGKHMKRWGTIVELEV